MGVEVQVLSPLLFLARENYGFLGLFLFAGGVRVLQGLRTKVSISSAVGELKLV